MTVTSPKFVVKIPEENITKKNRTLRKTMRGHGISRDFMPILRYPACYCDSKYARRHSGCKMSEMQSSYATESCLFLCLKSL